MKYRIEKDTMGEVNVPKMLFGELKLNELWKTLKLVALNLLFLLEEVL